MSRHPMSASADYENMLSAVRASGASQRELAAALSTIAALEKRIAGLEDQAWGLKIFAKVQTEALTAERKRREECEAVLREVAGAPNRIAENARIIAAYFGEWN